MNNIISNLNKSKYILKNIYKKGKIVLKIYIPKYLSIEVA